MSNLTAKTSYDAGLLNDFGGGNVEWWHDYIRAELGRSHDFYAADIERLQQLEAAARKVVAWLERTEASRAYYGELAELLP